MAFELLWQPPADEALRRLEETLPALRAVLARLAEDPHDPTLGTTRFVSDPFAGVRATPVGLARLHVFWRPLDERTIVVLDIHELPV